MRQFATRLLETRRARLGLGIIVALIIAAILAPLIAPYDPIQQLDLQTQRLLPPSLAHPFGTDDLSRDLLSRMLYGARISLAVASLSVTLSVIVGTLVGAWAGFAGGIVDTMLMRGVDAALAFPRIFLLIVVLVLWSDVGVPMLVLVLGLTSWFDMSRIVRAEVLSVRRREFIVAARALGAGLASVVGRHTLPNIATPIIVTATLGMGQMILLEAGLSFLGVGVPRPTPSWGVMIAESQAIMANAWWTAAFPGAAIMLTVAGFSLLGDALRDTLDPRRV